MPESEEKPLVVIRSLVYNHEPYLRDCLEGFVMQQTTFPFVAVVHDDCSTDGSAAIIREYAEKYPHIIKPVYETENQYSKPGKPLRRIMDEACGRYGAKYYALCEGDDYWTDPHKLQKQVDFMDSHPEYSMVSCNCEVHMPDSSLVTHEDFLRSGWDRCDENRELQPEEIIEKHGRMAHTAGLLFRAGLIDQIPAGTNKCENGDYRLQLTAMMAGKVYHMRDRMFVYRFMTPGSWNDRNKKVSDFGKLLAGMQAFIEMLEIFNEKTDGKFRESFSKAQEILIVWKLRMHPKASRLIKQHFSSIMLRKGKPGHFPHAQGWVTRNLLRLCYYPYHEFISRHSFTDLGELVNPAMKPFCMVTGPKLSIHIGPLNVLSLVGALPKDKLYFFGRRLF